MDHHDWDSWQHHDLPGDSGDPDDDRADGLDLTGHDGLASHDGDEFCDTPTDTADGHDHPSEPDPGFGDHDLPPPEEPLDLDPSQPPADHGHDDGWAATDTDGLWAPDTAGDDTPVPADHLIGVDPDLAQHTDDPTWTESPFPQPVDLETPPEPVDGFPWSDPTVLGDPHPGDDPAFSDDPAFATPTASASAADLADYASTDLPDGHDPWTALIGSPDPATSTLARWWAPGT